jgi:hypothetical protein
MRGLLMVVMSLTLAATGSAQSRHGSGGGSGSRVGARSFAGGGVRGGYIGGGYGRGFVNYNHGFVGTGRYYGGYGYGAGLGYSAGYAPNCYGPYYLWRLQLRLPTPRLLCGPDGSHDGTEGSDGAATRRDGGRRLATFRAALNRGRPMRRYSEFRYAIKSDICCAVNRGQASCSLWPRSALSR